MNIYNRIVLVLWVVFLVYWAISAFSAKRNAGGLRQWRTGAALRFGILALVVLAIRIPFLNRALRNGEGHEPASTLMRLIGVALCALGVALAIWARANLGRNWGMPMSRKESPELVTTGPYAFVRHPIYTGMLFAMCGSAMTVSIIWVVPLIFFGAYFIYSARREEKILIETFPEQYPAYMKRTRMLFPFAL